MLVDFTAKWCLTCNTIVKPTLEDRAVQEKIKAVNAVPFLANYTLQPASITAELKRFGRRRRAAGAGLSPRSRHPTDGLRSDHPQHHIESSEPGRALNASSGRSRPPAPPFTNPGAL